MSGPVITLTAEDVDRIRKLYEGEGMKTIGWLKKWTVDNKANKDGEPDPRMTITIEVPFHPKDATALGKLTSGDAISVEMVKAQREMNM